MHIIYNHNYNEVLHYYISDDLTTYNKYLIVFTITKVKNQIIKPKKILSKSEYCKTKLNTEEPKKLKIYINKFFNSIDRTELLITYNKLNSLNSDLLKEIIEKDISSLICEHARYYHHTYIHLKKVVKLKRKKEKNT